MQMQKISSSQLMDAMRAFAVQSHTVARARGFHAGGKDPAASLMFIVRNLGLAAGYLKRADRITEIKTGADGKPRGFPIKLADGVIGLFDLAEGLGIDLGDAVVRKTAWNAARARRG